MTTHIPLPSPMPRRPTRTVLVLLGLILVIGVLVRLILLGSVPFQHWDDVFTARAVITYYPKASTEFRLSAGSAADAPIPSRLLSPCMAA